MFEESENVINRFKLLEKDSMIDYSDDIELIFVELPKFDKKEKELQDIKDEWIYFIKNAGSLEYIPKNLDHNIKDALDTVNEANLTKDELEAQHKRKEFISIQRLALMKAKNDGIKQGIEQGIEKGIEQGIEKGIEQGIEKGREQGAKDNALEVAKNAILQKLDNETIKLITNLSENEIENIRKTTLLSF
jgi:predicted transposase/invertase (TIGR01784 family)